MYNYAAYMDLVFIVRSPRPKGRRCGNVVLLLLPVFFTPLQGSNGRTRQLATMDNDRIFTAFDPRVSYLQGNGIKLENVTVEDDGVIRNKIHFHFVGLEHERNSTVNVTSILRVDRETYNICFPFRFSSLDLQTQERSIFGLLPFKTKYNAQRLFSLQSPCRWNKLSHIILLLRSLSNLSNLTCYQFYHATELYL